MDYYNFKSFCECNWENLIYVLRTLCYDTDYLDDLSFDRYKESYSNELYANGISEEHKSYEIASEIKHFNEDIEVICVTDIEFNPDFSDYAISVSYENRYDEDEEISGDAGNSGRDLSDFFLGILDIIDAGMCDFILSTSYGDSDQKWRSIVQELYKEALIFEGKLEEEEEEEDWEDDDFDDEDDE
jgi:hypothetical protein